MTMLSRLIEEIETHIPVPVLNVSGLCGSTGYIDFISADMVESQHKNNFGVVKGTDDYGRLFLSLCLDVKVQYGDNKKIKKIKIVDTIFERYSDLVDNLAFGSCYSSVNLFNDSRIKSIDELSPDRSRSRSEFQLLSEKIKKLASGLSVTSKELQTCKLIDSPPHLDFTLYFDPIKKVLIDTLSNYIIKDLSGLIVSYL